MWYGRLVEYLDSDDEESEDVDMGDACSLALMPAGAAEGQDNANEDNATVLDIHGSGAPLQKLAIGSPSNDSAVHMNMDIDGLNNGNSAAPDDAQNTTTAPAAAREAPEVNTTTMSSAPDQADKAQAKQAVAGPYNRAGLGKIKAEKLSLAALGTLLRKNQDDLNIGAIRTYVLHATFTVDVWINFDAADYQFYTDQRTKECGRLRLTSATRDLLEMLNDRGCKFGNIQMLVGTPFRTLVEVDIRFVTTKDGTCKADVKGRYKPPGFHTDKPMWFKHYANECAAEIREELGLRQFEHLDLLDLAQLAHMFVRRPTAQDAKEYEWVDNQVYDMWAGKSSEHTDFGEQALVAEAIAKGKEVSAANRARASNAGARGRSRPKPGLGG